MQENPQTNQFVTFKIENEIYAVDVFKVREILEVPDITRVPGMPPMIRGVINIRGSVVPVLDMKMKFGLEQTEETQDTAVIVTEITNADGIVQIGIIVDAAREVITLEAEDFEEPPRLGIFIDNKYLSGMGKVNEEFIIILNIDKILSEDEISQVAISGTPAKEA
ncbi:MAG: chemotaxis protein CheW [Spirochaetales bacterium]|uniref:Chemotaxis protein CheW n=1 Tax=Candidatus Thalassospirochaeta sargassi TaxID=3119039 RepID=A0AAJ1IF63_9SPIO|nr:chemotaxis protein CheW [Spirochaetales bacterium]